MTSKNSETNAVFEFQSLQNGTSKRYMNVIFMYQIDEKCVVLMDA